MDANTDDQYTQNQSENLDNVINIGGTTAIYIDGQYYIPTNTKAILLPDTEHQYVINDEDNILSSDNNSETIFDNSGIVQFVNDPRIINKNEIQVVYYTNEIETPVDSVEADCAQNSQLTLVDNNESLLKKIQLGAEYININSLLNVDIPEPEENDNLENYHYIVQLDNTEPTENPEYFPPENVTEVHVNNNINGNIVDGELNIVDYSKITGKNLLTGQTVTLDSYLQKLWNSNKELTLKKAEEVSQSIRKKCQYSALSNLLNKKLTIGKTLSGQKLVGKIIHVGKKNLDVLSETESRDITPRTVKIEEAEEETEHNIDDEVFNYNSTESQITNAVILEENLDSNISNDMILPLMETDQDSSNQLDTSENPQEEENPSDPNKHMIDYVSKTLTNLMGMESVAKKLKRKNLLIKITEKVIKEHDVKINIFHLKGYLEMLGGWEEGSYEEKWLFKLEDDSSSLETARRFPKTMLMLISIVQVDGVVQSTKVNLNYCQEKCRVCRKQFRTVIKLKAHMKLAHQMGFYCQICDRPLRDKEDFDRHRANHVEKKELFPCSKCSKHFLSELKRSKHALTHDTEPWNLTCTVCGETCRKRSTWRKHMLSHNDSKPYTCPHCFKQFYTVDDLKYHVRVHESKNCYVCKVCGRTFSRYSNLQRHAEIHGTKNSVSVFSCSICGCTYNYVSSLTRHIVQNHISST